MNCSFYEYKTKRQLANGEIKTYVYKHKYIKKGCKFDGIKIKFKDIINNEQLKPVEKIDQILKNMTEEEKKQFNKSQITNFIYRVK